MISAKAPELRQEPVQGIVHQVRAEPVVAGLDRRVGGEDAFRLGLRLGLGKFLPGGHFFADQFQREEGRVAFVHVEDRGLEPSARSRRTPPMPSRISCMMRVVLSPP